MAIPSILEAGGVSRICASLLKPNETLTVTVSLKSQELNITLMQLVSRQEFHMCREFEVSCSHTFEGIPMNSTRILKSTLPSSCRRFHQPRKTM